jgi:hypothetical protein
MISTTETIHSLHNRRKSLSSYVAADGGWSSAFAAAVCGLPTANGAALRARLAHGASAAPLVSRLTR